MKKRDKSRLQLNKETLALLEGSPLRLAAGVVFLPQLPPQPDPTTRCNLTVFTTRPVGCGIYSDSCESVCICNF